MSALTELIEQVDNTALKERLFNEVNRALKNKQFGLVFEEHLPECTPLYDIQIKVGSKVSYRNKKINTIFIVKQIDDENAICEDVISKEIKKIQISKLVSIAEFGEPVYPYLKIIDTVCNAPEDSLWHSLIQADNFHALQLLEYLYKGKVQCIYIDPPYNTGAHDWKYNNDYVDSNDEYRHSKWLSLIKKRLLLAKKLLDPKDSILIVTIDEKEYLHLGCLLEELFPEAKIQMVSDVINPRGTTRDGQFSRTDEYIFLIQLGNNSVCYPKKKEKHYVEWYRLRRTDFESRRGTTKGGTQQFYPIYVDIKTEKIVKIGDPLSLDQKREDVPQIKGSIPVFPIKNDGTEMNWGVTPETLKRLMGYHFVRVRKNNEEKFQPYLIHYISYKMIEAIEKGNAKIEGYNKDGTAIVVEEEGHIIRPGSAWNISTHNAGTYGSEIIADLIGEKRFNFPKSLYSVADILRYYLKNKPNALVIDFFAGSGTTLHAINLLNSEDNGKRKCILVTNNEVSEKEAKELSKLGLQPGDEEWEKYGIAQYVTWPRTKCSILGKNIKGKLLNGNYITNETKEIIKKRTIKQVSIDLNKEKLIVRKQILSLLKDNDLKIAQIDESTPFIVNNISSNAILIDCNTTEDFIEHIGQNVSIIYVFTSDNKLFKELKERLSELSPIIINEPVLKPMHEGFKSNAIFFQLSFLNKNSVALGRQFKNLLPLLWMKAGSYGPCPIFDNETEVSDMLILTQNKMAILLDENQFNKFKEIIQTKKEIETIYIITDSYSGYSEMANELNIQNSFQIYRDYLDNFRINCGR